MAEEERKLALGKAIKKAIEYCAGRGILVDFLKENAGEVMNMLTMEFDINVAEMNADVTLREVLKMGYI